MNNLPVILIVEDDKDLNYLIQITLQREGFITKCAFNGTDAISMITDDPDILLLLDYILPDMRGDNIIEKLTGQGLAIPFITITGHGDEKTAVEMMKMGARDYLVKGSGLVDILPHVVKRTAKELAKEKELSESEEKLREKEEKYRTLFEASGDAIFLLQISEEDGPVFVDCNPTTLAMFRCSRKEIIGKGPQDFSPPIQPDGRLSGERILEMLDAVKVGNPQSFEWTNCRLDGTSFIAEVTLNAFNTKNKNYMQAIVRDITERKQMEDKLRKWSINDELTGIYNRRGFFALVEHQLKMVKRENKKVRLLYADMDNLKEINDTFGHQEGDNALIESANILKKTYRESDIIARIGGDEFVVYLTGCSEDSIEAVAGRLQEKLDIHNSEKESGCKLSISVGISCYDPEFPCTIDELLAKADKLMYKQKKLKQTV
jgi:diguanylate cyclase (GGDEF)-like protein/PAS domain S-box-containing protein